MISAYFRFTSYVTTSLSDIIFHNKSYYVNFTIYAVLKNLNKNGFLNEVWNEGGKERIYQDT